MSFTTPPAPIGGNLSFTNVRSYQEGGVVDQLNASSVMTENLNADYGVLDLQGPTTVPVTLNTLKKFECYAPTGFSTAASSSTFSLLNAPGLAAATAASDTKLAKFPAAAYVLKAVVTNNGTAIVGGTDFDIGTDAAVNTTSDTIFDAVVLADVNLVGGSQVESVAAGAFSGVGAAVNRGLSVAAAQIMQVTVNTTANTAGDLKVTVWYVYQ